MPSSSGPTNSPQIVIWTELLSPTSFCGALHKTFVDSSNHFNCPLTSNVPCGGLEIISFISVISGILYLKITEQSFIRHLVLPL